MSWNRRAWIEADLKFEQSQEPAVVLRKVEFGRQAWRKRWVIREVMWEWMFRKKGWMSRCGPVYMGPSCVPQKPISLLPSRTYAGF